MAEDVVLTHNEYVDTIFPCTCEEFTVDFYIAMDRGPTVEVVLEALKVAYNKVKDMANYDRIEVKSVHLGGLTGSVKFVCYKRLTDGQDAQKD